MRWPIRPWSSATPVARFSFSNNDWQENPAQAALITGSGLAPGNGLESAIVATLPANNASYTAIVRGFGNGTGIGVVEGYDLDRTVDSKLANISTRGFVSTGDNVMIGGMIVVGTAPANVLIRAIGPSLVNFGVPNALPDPTLELRDGNGTLLASNDDWRTRSADPDPCDRPCADAPLRKRHLAKPFARPLHRDRA